MDDPYPIPHPRVVDAEVVVPGSKSITNRALVCAALAHGTSRIIGGLDSDDTRVMRAGLRTLGASIEEDGDGWRVTGSPGDIGSGSVDVHASGTTMRFLVAVAALGGPVALDGTPRMRERPLGPLLDALRTLGADIEFLGTIDHPPVRIGGPIDGGEAAVDGTVSSQFVTALLLIGPVLPKGLHLTLTGLTSAPYLETTREVMEAFGASVAVDGDVWSVAPTGYTATDFIVEPDASAAVYPWVGAAITGGAAQVLGLPASSSQADVAVLDVLADMGARIDDAATPTVFGPTTLRGVEADLAHCPDGAMALVVAAATATGRSRFTGLATLRRKETDRLAALSTELGRLGIEVEAGEDWIEVHGGHPGAGTVATYDDHRMAMSFAMLGLTTAGIRIADPTCVAKTWPGFWQALDQMVRPVATEVVAIDGPAGTGKTTVASAVAGLLGGTRLDTGAFYRSATLLAHRAGVDPGDGPGIRALLDHADLGYADGAMRIDGEDVSEAIRTPEVNAAVSAVSAHPIVREALVRIQRRWAAGADRVTVVEGRDIGTVVFPDARLKVYLDARPEVRAARRAREAGTDTAEEARRLAARDALDSGRTASPLRPAGDAWHLDTSDLSVDEVVAAIVDRWRASTSGQ
jgi:3-phosphoshikimate 1-carboxyvinyltransferase